MRIASMILRIAGVIALILGVLLWFGVGILDSIHMLFGLLVVLSIWAIGFFMMRVKGGISLAVADFVIGLLVLLIGLNQRAWLSGSSHWIIQVIHLLLGLAAIALGEISNGRYRKGNAVRLA